MLLGIVQFSGFLDMFGWPRGQRSSCIRSRSAGPLSSSPRWLGHPLESARWPGSGHFWWVIAWRSGTNEVRSGSEVTMPRDSSSSKTRTRTSRRPNNGSGAWPTLCRRRVRTLQDRPWRVRRGWLPRRPCAGHQEGRQGVQGAAAARDRVPPALRHPRRAAVGPGVLGFPVREGRRRHQGSGSTTSTSTNPRWFSASYWLVVSGLAWTAVLPAGQKMCQYLRFL